MQSFTRIIGSVLLLAGTWLAASAQPVVPDRSDMGGSSVRIADELEDERVARASEEELLELREHPLNLNRVTKFDLLRLPMMTAAIARRIIVRRDTHGVYLSVRELRSVFGVDRKLYASIVPYLSVTPDRSSFSSRSRTSIIAEQQEGFRTGAYPGNPMHTFERLDGLWSGWEGHLVAEKDAGERSLVDHAVWSAAYTTEQHEFEFVGGAFDLAFGQGLMLWKPAATGKSSEVIRAPCRKASEVTPAHSAVEYGGYRGAALTWTGPATVIAWYSDAAQDASLSEGGTFTSLQSTGLHRTASELAGRDAVRERMLGSHLSWTGNDAMIGLSLAWSRFNHPWVTHGDSLGSMWNIGFDWHADLAAGYLFGECAIDQRGDVATVAGGTTRLGEAIECTGLFRHFPAHYIAMHANPFGEHSTVENEDGGYVGMRWIPGKRFVISAFYDLFVFPRASTAIAVPSYGHEQLLAIDLECSQRVTLRLLSTWKSSPLMITHVNPTGDSSRWQADSWRRRERAEVVYAEGQVRIRGRIELVQYRKSVEHMEVAGSLAFVDVSYRPLPELLLTGRVAVFHTENFDSRVYEYEDGLAGTSSIPALYGAGNRMYLHAAWHITETCVFEMKWSELLKPQVSSIGSGLDLIPGPAQHSIEAQLSLKL